MTSGSSEDTYLPAGHRQFKDIKFYYPNLIDYVRIAMCVGALFTIHFNWAATSAFLIAGSYALDFVDGKVARRYNQCTIFGDGLDWSTDLFCSLLLALWWIHLEPSIMPWIALATLIDIYLAIFDFGITATDRYPPRGPQKGLRIILEWCIPRNRWTRFGTFLWCAYPLFIIARCLDLSWPVRHEFTGSFLQVAQYVLFVPALLWVWCDFAWLLASVSRWTEAKK